MSMTKIVTTTALASTLLLSTGLSNISHAAEKDSDESKDVKVHVINDQKEKDSTKDEKESSNTSNEEEMAHPPKNPDHSHDHDGYHDNTPKNAKKVEDTQSEHGTNPTNEAGIVDQEQNTQAQDTPSTSNENVTVATDNHTAQALPETGQTTENVSPIATSVLILGIAALSFALTYRRTNE